MGLRRTLLALLGRRVLSPLLLEPLDDVRVSGGASMELELLRKLVVSDRKEPLMGRDSLGGGIVNVRDGR